MRNFILEKLNFLSSSLKLGNIYVGLPGREAPSTGNFMPVARFNTVISGDKQVELPLNDGARTVTLNTGDAHYSPLDSWETQTWNTPHELLCIVPRANYLRISYYRVDENLGKYNIYYHTGRPYSSAMRHTLEALNACSINQHDEHPIRHLCEALIQFSLIECSKPPAAPLNKALHTFEQIKMWLENSFEQDINREVAAKQFQLSPSYISQLFTKTCGVSFHEYLINCRLNFAENLLRRTNLTIYQIADQCGFKNHVHFVRRFREIKGVPPGQYRMHILNQTR